MLTHASSPVAVPELRQKPFDFQIEEREKKQFQWIHEKNFQSIQ